MKLIIRCYECKHRGDPVNCPMCHEEIYCDEGYNDYYIIDDTIDNGFCHSGEKYIYKSSVIVPHDLPQPISNFYSLHSRMRR